MEMRKKSGFWWAVNYGITGISLVETILLL
jgi:ABC-type transporter MlaC component